MSEDAIERLAELCGIDERYRDAWGAWREVPRSTRAAILTALGYDVSTPAAADAELRRREAADWLTPLPPVLVVHQGSGTASAPLSVAETLGGTIAWRIDREDGGRLQGEAPLAGLRIGDLREDDGRRSVRRWLDLPALPIGYHRLTVELPGPAPPATCPVIVAPPRCHVPPHFSNGYRSWGISTQLYSLRSSRNWGMGDFTDLERFVDLVADAGGGIIGVNPLHSLFPGRPEHCSPYTPSSRLALNVLYIDVEAVPDFAECPDARRRVADPKFRAELDRLRDMRLVDYRAVAACKLPVLVALYGSFRARHLDGSSGPSARGRAFRAFQGEEQGCSHVALFEALAEHLGRGGISNYDWRNWPEPFRDPDHRDLARLAAEHRTRVEFHQYLQWIAAEQLRRCGERAASRGMDVGLYVDLALGADANGADGWALRHVLARGAAAGAPPDLLNLKGQDWGFAPFHPDALRAAAYAPFVEMLRANMRPAGAIRLDHVLGLRRLYWIPPGVAPADGGYVRYPLDDLLAVIALESVRNRCMVIGEDLGTLPEGLRERLQQSALLSYRVLPFERGEGGTFRGPPEYPTLSLVTAATHDMAPLAAWWRGDDLRLRERLDLYPSEEAHRSALAERPAERRHLLEALQNAGLAIDPSPDPGVDGQDPPDALIQAVHRFLARTPSMLLLAHIEDMIGETEPINVPGTTSEYPNWRRSLSLPLERMAGDPQVRAIFALLAAERPTRSPSRQARM